MFDVPQRLDGNWQAERPYPDDLVVRCLPPHDRVAARDVQPYRRRTRNVFDLSQRQYGDRQAERTCADHGIV